LKICINVVSHLTCHLFISSVPLAIFYSSTQAASHTSPDMASFSFKNVCHHGFIIELYLLLLACSKHISKYLSCIFQCSLLPTSNYLLLQRLLVGPVGFSFGHTFNYICFFLYMNNAYFSQHVIFFLSRSLQYMSPPPLRVALRDHCSRRAHPYLRCPLFFQRLSSTVI
jgi:hypothetical protein